MRPSAVPGDSRGPSVSVVVATFNGARFLEEQLASIFAQSHAPAEVIAVDDGSTDSSVDILREFQHRHGLRWMANDLRLGPAQTFSRGASNATGRYIAFADQDDVWCRDKLERALAAIAGAERAGSAVRPALVYSDAELIDADGRPLAGSFYARIGRRPNTNAFNRVLNQGIALGCTSMVNRALADLALPVPAEASMHDWWFALVASAFGSLEFIPDALVRYRQHGGNAVGVRRSGLTGKLRNALSWNFSSEAYRALLMKGIRQARAFRSRYAAQLSPRQRRQLDAYCDLLELGLLEKRWTILRHGFVRTPVWETLEMLLRV